MGLVGAIIGFVVGIAVIAVAVWILEAAMKREERRVDRLREQGVLPAEGAASMADVDAQLARGERALAARLYVEIHGTSLMVARREVARLERSRR
ncbi:MAG: hypothetical protein U0229_20990 [Anaeromyxobacter sp.]